MRVVWDGEKVNVWLSQGSRYCPDGPEGAEFKLSIRQRMRTRRSVPGLVLGKQEGICGSHLKEGRRVP